MDMYQKREQRKKKKEEEQNKSCLSVPISWYPGHMVKTKRQIQEDLKLIDVVVEILDARAPEASRNPDILELTKSKKRIILLNKSDLSDDKENQKWINFFVGQGFSVIKTNANTGQGIKEIIKEIERIMQPELEAQAKKGRIGKPIRAMILGIPNVGKSSLINKMVKKASAKVGNRPGVTRQKQWVKLSNKIDLLDTPGVLPPKFDNKEIALNLSYIGTIKDENLEITEIAYYLLKYLYENYINNLEERYKLTEQEIESLEENKVASLMELIAKKRGAIRSGGITDNDKISRIIIDDFRSGKLGNITLEKKESN